MARHCSITGTISKNPECESKVLPCTQHKLDPFAGSFIHSFRKILGSPTRPWARLGVQPVNKTGPISILTTLGAETEKRHQELEWETESVMRSHRRAA